MPRNYIKKKIKTYTPQDVAEAIQKVKSGELTQYSAAHRYNIPVTTLHDHIKESTKSIRLNAGRPTVIPLEHEKKLPETIVVMEKWGFGLSRLEIMEIVAEYVRINNIQTPFKNNVRGPDWFINFRKRHRLSIKKAQAVEFVRRKMTDPFVIAEYFDLLENTLRDFNLFESPQVIWNLDETSMCLDPSRTKVVGQINKPCARTTHGTGKENITVLTGASASGKKLPPLIVFKGKFVWDQWMADLDPVDYDFEISYAASAKGWMETDIFFNYIEKVLIPNLGEQRPVLVIYDGHSTHVNVRVVQLAIQNNIIILKLPPHTSHLLQPMDIAVFKSFKTIWDAKLVDWQRRNVGTKMPKKVFAQALADTWQQTSSDVIKSGFKKAGIYPFNKHVIPVHMYNPDAYRRYQKKLSEAHFAGRNPQNPNSLKEIFMHFYNNLSTSSEAHEEPNNDDVTLLSQLSKSDEQTSRFVVQHPSQIPIYLRDSQHVQNQTSQNTSKIHIVSNILIKKASQPSSESQVSPQQTCTFEELVLRKIQQDKKVATSKKKKRVTKGAELITATMAKTILEEIEKSKRTKLPTKKGKTDKKKPTKISTKNNSTYYMEQNQDEQPCTSGIKIRINENASLHLTA
ncbi:unnamed protein product [Euphydryas editha]|uniref:HTH psq-type domain-containing protein n=1 Tax=Euphydryas editha TaxID=104508 RepID=A0AAU9UTP6_EUPED|nr:unnamed protein product [Euphydryas editha]